MRGFVFLLVLLCGGSVQAETRYYLVEKLAEVAPEPGLRAQSAELQAMYDRLAERAGVDATLLYADSPDINAFATEAGGKKLVVVNRGLVELLDEDRDALAAVIGHELAHHKADHVRAGHRKQKNVKAFGALLGAVVGAKIGQKHGDLAGALGGAAVGVGAGLVALKFNRTQELEADRLSVQWLAQGDYQPDGMLRLQSRLGELAGKGKRQAGIFATHPASDKRYKAAAAQIARLGIEAQPEQVALVDGAALARAEQAIREQREARLAEALRPADAGELDAAALAPVEGVSFEQYVAVNNQLVRSGAAGEGPVLKAHRLDPASFARVQATFRARMRAQPALAAKYSAAYLRASSGPLEAHARDVADSMELARPLQLDPPYPLTTALGLLSAVSREQALRLEGSARADFEARELAPHGLSLYDFLIGHAWWSRKARIDAALGDTATLRALAAAQSAPPRAQAAESGVKVGDNVNIGKGVRIGGQAVQEDGSRPR